MQCRVCCQWRGAVIDIFDSKVIIFFIFILHQYIVTSGAECSVGQSPCAPWEKANCGDRWDRLNFRFSIQTSGGPDFANTIHHRPGSGWQPPLKPGLRMSPVLKPLLVVLTLYLSGSGLCSCRLQWARQHWLKLRVHNCLTCDDEPDKHCASSGTLGVDRRHIKTFFKDPSRLNVFPQIRTFDRIASRFQNTQYLLNVSRIGSYNWFQQLGQKHSHNLM